VVADHHPEIKQMIEEGSVLEADILEKAVERAKV